MTMCSRWHIKGDCYDTCPHAITHMLGNKVPPNQKADFLIFMKEYKECVANNNKDWLIGTEPSGVQPPKKPPKSSVPKTIPLHFDFEYKPLSAHMIPMFLPQVPLNNLCHQQWASWKITTEPEGPSPWLPSTTATATKRQETASKKLAMRQH